ncbi:ABC transporter substrate-binding protein, partial [Candidatus Bipolaricaulota bacterium]|nr:ABC transporter substrate-binding protein [Candidatus Bipolaricaulota bacterium]
MNKARFLVVSLLLVVLLSAVGLSKETLTIYTAFDADQAVVYIEAFEAAYPEIDVEWVRLSSGEVYVRLLAEAANPQASLWFGGSNTSHIAAAKAGLLEPYKESLAWQYIAPQFRDTAGMWIGLYV